MPSSLPKYSGLISEHQLSILDEFIALHDGISKARVLGRLLEAWQDAGKPILGDRDRTLRDRLLQFEQLDLDGLVAQKVREYLDIHLDSLVNNLVKNKLATNDLEDDESLAESNIADDGDLKVVTEDDREVFSLPVQDKQQEDKQKEESDQVSNKDINQDNNLNSKNTNKGIDLVDNSSKKDSNEDVDLLNNLREKDNNKDINQVENLSEEDISPTEEGHNKVSNKVSNKLIENNETKREFRDSFMSTITEENSTSQLVITLDKSEVNNQADISDIPADFLALPKGRVGTKMLAEVLGFTHSVRVTELGNGKRKTPPFPEFWDYMKVETIVKMNKNGEEVNRYEWTKIK